MSNVVPMRARAPWTETNEGKLLAQWKWLLALNADPNVSSAGKHVACYLLDKFDEAKGYAFPGYASITKANGIGRKGAMAAIASLEAEGWFRVLRTHEGSNSTGGPRSVNRYVPQWGRVAAGKAADTSHQSEKDTAPSPEKGLPVSRLNAAKQSSGRTGQSEKGTGQSSDGHWGSPLEGTGAVSEGAPDSTYSTYPTYHPVQDSAYAPEVSGGGRASAPLTTGSGSRAGIEILPLWRPSSGVWEKAVKQWGEDRAEDTLESFTMHHFRGEPVINPDAEWLSWFDPF